MSEQEPTSIDPRVNSTIAGSVERQNLWQSVGMPISPPYMTEEEMNRHYRGRFSCINAQLLREAQLVMKFVACPACVKAKSYGEIAVTRLHITVIDDPMTTFKALGRCFCFNCAHEEFWPLRVDPRPSSNENAEFHQAMAQAQASLNSQRSLANQAMGQLGNLGAAIGGGMAGGQAGLGSAIGQMLGGQPIPGASQAEREALQRIYNQAMQVKLQKIAPPPMMSKEYWDDSEEHSKLRKYIKDKTGI